MKLPIEKELIKEIENGLYFYEKLEDIFMKKAIDLTLEYFKGKKQCLIINEYYFKAKKSKYMKSEYFMEKVLKKIKHQQNHFYELRREIIIRIALILASMGRLDFT